ncbi:MAG: hypothetical protein ACR2QE_02960, partial [Acidimicrobiales bacterium]
MTVPDMAYLAAVLSLERMWPRRARLVLARRTPEVAWRALGSGELARSAVLARGLGRGGTELLANWQRAVGELDVARLWERHQELGVGVARDSSFPAALVDDPAPPVALFHRGS